jgi:H+/Cl- antiporter ClcA
MFAQGLISATEGRMGEIVKARPILIATVLAVLVALIGWGCGGLSYGTGYGAARALLGGTHLPWYYFPAKFLATIFSYLTGIPGGIFAPSLSVGAAMGDLLSHVVPNAPAGTVVLLGMTAYFTGVVQAPITSIVIVMEMTNNQQMAMPIMASAVIAWVVSRQVCRVPFYGALAHRFGHQPGD